MADEGSITYPYSTREVVNIVKHLQVELSRHISLLNLFSQRFPDDGLGTVVRNVFDFDGYSKEVWIPGCKDGQFCLLARFGIRSQKCCTSMVMEMP